MASSSAATSAKAKPSAKTTNASASASFLRFKSNFKFRNHPPSARRRARPSISLSLAIPTRSISAHVVKVSPTVDPASDSYDVTAQLTGPGISDLRPGMAVRVIWPGTSHAKP